MIRVGIRMRIKPPVRRSPTDRIKSRLYYRKNKAKIRSQRRRYLRKYRSQLKNRKMFQRFKPTWFKKRAPGGTSSPKKFKPAVPKRVKK